MKFSTQFSLDDISVEFADKKDCPGRSLVIAKIVIFLYGFQYENRSILALRKTFSHRYISFDREFRQLLDGIENIKETDYPTGIPI